MSANHIPVFHLRKHVCLLLQHARIAIPGCEASISIQDSGPAFDHDESSFCQRHHLTFPYHYHVTKDRIGDTWKMIHNHWVAAFKKRADDIPRSFRQTVAKKSRLQTDLYHGLLVWDAGTLKRKKQKAPTVPLPFALAVGELARLVCQELRDTKANQEINSIQSFLESENSAGNPEYGHEFAHRVMDFWCHKPELGNALPAIFTNSTWTCYERTDGISDAAAQWGIALSSITVGKPDEKGFMPINMHSKYVRGESYYKGIIAKEPKSDHLVAQLLRESDAMLPAFFVMRLNPSMPETQQLLIGHFLHYSVYYRHYLTKTVVWVKTDKSSQPQDLTEGEPAFANLPQSIKSFLKNRLRNRLTMPSKDVTTDSNADDRHSLHHWLIKNNKAIIENPTLLAYVGDYFICYYHGEAAAHEQPATRAAIAKLLRVDRLAIWYDRDSMEFRAEYTHKRGGAAESTYRGVARFNSSTIQLLLNEFEDEKDSDTLFQRKAQANFVHITVSTPLVHPVALQPIINAHDYFPGIVSGLNDEHNTPVSFRMAIVKREKFLNKNELKTNQVFVPADHLNNPVLQKVIKYFKAHLHNLSIKVN
jgi:hypothetical protein